MITKSKNSHLLLWYLMTGLMLISLWGCRSEMDKFKAEVRKLSRDGMVTAEEWNQLKDLIAGNPELETIDDAELENIISTSLRNKTVEIIKPSEQPPRPEVKTAFNVYVENSGSMFGYMDGNSEFKKCLYDLLTRFNGENDPFSVKLINDKIHPVEKDLSEFMDFFEKKNLANIGNTASSKINKIFQMVRDSMLIDQKTAIVISDFIYSLDKHEDMTNELAMHKFSTKAVFQKIKDDYGAMVIKSISSFNDKFYPFNSPNKGVRINEDRPYYIWIIGKREEIIKFADKYNIETLDGYKNHLKIYNSDISNKPFYTILNATDKAGSFRKEKGSNVINSISKVDYDRKGIFQFAVAVNFKDQYIEEEYLTDSENYRVISSVSDKFDVVGVSAIDQVDKNDKRFIGEATHFITIQTDNVSTGEQTLQLELIKKIPDWVEDSSTLDDSSPEKRDNKTFAFLNLVEGVTEAFYKTNQDDLTYFSLPLKLKR